MLTEALAPSAIADIKRDNPALFSAQRRYLRYLGISAVLIAVYYVYFFTFYGIPWDALVRGTGEIGRYFLRMFVWHNFSQWPLMYYFQQIVMTLAIVFAGTITASFLALPLSDRKSTRLNSSHLG